MVMWSSELAGRGRTGRSRANRLEKPLMKPGMRSMACGGGFQMRAVGEGEAEKCDQDVRLTGTQQESGDGAHAQPYLPGEGRPPGRSASGQLGGEPSEPGEGILTLSSPEYAVLFAIAHGGVHNGERPSPRPEARASSSVPPPTSSARCFLPIQHTNCIQLGAMMATMTTTCC